MGASRCEPSDLAHQGQFFVVQISMSWRKRQAAVQMLKVSWYWPSVSGGTCRHMVRTVWCPQSP